jgi:hypothetical protein
MAVSTHIYSGILETKIDLVDTLQYGSLLLLNCYYAMGLANAQISQYWATSLG